MKPIPKTVERILEGVGQRPAPSASSATSGPTAIASDPRSASPWRWKARGKTVTVWNEDVRARQAALPRSRPPRSQAPRSMASSFDVVVATDCASFERLGRVGEHIEQREPAASTSTITRRNTKYGDINWISPREPSSGELIYDLCDWAGWKITQPIADLPVHRHQHRHRQLPISEHDA
jgi:hypothetical protein